MPVNPHLKINDLIDMAVKHQLSVPEFQRGFVWKPTQVRDLAESLWLEYPIGSLLIWNSDYKGLERNATDAQSPGEWLVDGQQRATALCILFGRKPYWWPDAKSWENTIKRYDIRFDIEAKEPPYFWVANAAIRKTRGSRWVRLSDLLNKDTAKEVDLKFLQTLSRNIKEEGLCDGMDAMEVYTHLDRVRKIREKDLVTITVNHELEDVVEIFARLNSRGTRVTEADIYLGIVAARTPTWVRTEFLPFLEVLKDTGFDLSPNLLFRSLTAITAGKTRFREIPNNMWDTEVIAPGWQKCTRAWQNIIKRFSEFGIFSNAVMPTEAALVTLIALLDKFPSESSFNLPLYWFLHASRFGRYSGSGATALDEDLKSIKESETLHDAVIRLLDKFDHTKQIEAEEFMDDYSNARFGRFLLYLLVYQNGAKDWDEKGFRLGFDGQQILKDFQPQWHHIFPRKFLGNDYAEDQVNALANIAVIGPTINIKISAKNPMDYIKKYQITKDKLGQQFITEEIAVLPKEKFLKFTEERAQRLATEANSYLNKLGKDIEI